MERRPGIADESGMSPLFHLLWTAFRLTVWWLMLVLIWPRVLHFVGGETTARWLLHHGWARWVGLPLLLPFFIFSAFSLRVGSKATADAGTGEAQPALDLELGLREGAVQRWPVDDHVIEAATWSRDGSRQCVCTAKVAVSSGHCFSARSARMEPAWFRGAAQAAMKMGIEHARKTGTDAQAETWDAMSFLTDAPLDLSDLPHGEDIVLRTSQPMLARALFSDSEIGCVIHELEQADRRWECSLLPDGQPGETVLRFACRGSLENAEVAGWAQRLMSAAVRRLAA
jgi:hypothetical protein